MAALLTIFVLSTGALVYPFLIYPLVLRLLPKCSPEPRTGPIPRRAALLIAARNERAVLPDLLRRVQALRGSWPGLQVLIWQDGSTDGSRAILQGWPAGITVLHSPKPVGKAAGLRQLLNAVDPSVDLLVFMDANTEAAPQALGHLRMVFADPNIGAAAARSISTGPKTGLARRYWALEEHIKRLESATGSTMGCDGAFWAIRRDLYSPAQGAECDDFVPSMRVLQLGYRVVSAANAAVSEPAISDAHAPARAVRIAAGAWHSHRRLWPGLRTMSRLDRFKYLSHKLMRWFAGLWLAMAATSAAAILVLADQAALLLSVMALGALAGLLRLPIWRGVLRIGWGFLATTLGVIRAQFGYGARHWNTVRDP